MQQALHQYFNTTNTNVSRQCSFKKYVIFVFCAFRKDDGNEQQVLVRCFDLIFSIEKIRLAASREYLSQTQFLFAA